MLEWLSVTRLCDDGGVMVCILCLSLCSLAPWLEMPTITTTSVLLAIPSVTNTITTLNPVCAFARSLNIKLGSLDKQAALCVY